MKKSIALVFALVAIQSQFAIADQVVMDFQDLESPGGGFVDQGFVYTAGDWMVSHPNTEPFEFATAQTGNGQFYQGSTMLFNNTVDGVITFERIDGGLFDLQSIDIAALFVGAQPTTVNFTSNNGDVESFTTPDGFGGYTFSFSDDFNSVTSVSWVQTASVNGFHQFDNINAKAGVIPEPSSCFVLALIGIAIGARRRNK